MLKRFKAWLHSIRLMSADPVISTITQVSTIQEDSSAKESVKRVRRAFDAQEQDMNIRAMKRHGPKCKGIALCKKEDCFKWKPDKIVSKKYTVEKEEETRKRMSKVVKSFDDRKRDNK